LTSNWHWEGGQIPSDQLGVGYRPPEERLYYNTVGCEASKILLKLGDAVHLKSPSDEAQRPYVASVQAMYQDRNSTDKMIVIAWYFRPEELKGGRTPAHGKDELLLKNGAGGRLVTYSLCCVEETCHVLDFPEYCRVQAEAKRRSVLGMPPVDTKHVYFVRDGRDAIAHMSRKPQPKRRFGDAESRPRPQRPKHPVADINKRNNKGETKLHVACCKGQLRTVEELLRSNASVNVTCNAGWTPLHEASLNGHLRVVDQLISADADVNVIGPGSTTPLHDATENAHMAVVKSLLRAGACKDIRNAEGKLAVDMAEGDADMTQALQETRKRRRAATNASWTIRAQHDINNI